MPSVSVVVASRNRAQRLPRLAAALCTQAYDGSFEVIVVDDASTDETPTVLLGLAREWPALRWLRQERRCGPGGARNAGWCAARGDLVAFTDDDAVPQQGWLAALVEGLQIADIAQGRVEPDPEQGANWGPFSRTVGVESESGLYETSNIAYRKEWLIRLNGFDPVFSRAGEDADLAWRAKRLGAITAWVPSAVVRHDVEPSSWWRALRETRRAAGVVRLLDRHPALASRLETEPSSWASRRARVLIGSMGLGLALRQPWALLAALPYLRYRLHNAPVGRGSSERLRLLPAVWSVDLAETMANYGTRLWMHAPLPKHRRTVRS